MQRDLIYDVGMYNGDDTARYLQRGFRVLAIEANPVFAKVARERFDAAIAEGRLTLLNVAVAPKGGVIPFWVSASPEFSSLALSNASRYGQSCESIEVPARPFAEILAEHGVPYYLKIDIEGADYLCLDAIDSSDSPTYLSFEKWNLRDLLTAQQLGYSRFKLIAQKDFRQLFFDPAAAWKSGRVGRRLERWRRRLAGLLKVAVRRERDCGPRFPCGSSGPFGEETDGPWRTFEQAACTWLAFDLGYTGSRHPKLHDWFDVHCTR
jgi:FkbM family methyltransferase